MMKIGLMGVPGAGKTKLAKALAERFDLTVVDGYAEWVTDHYDWVLGSYASYAGNLAVALERHARENRLRENFVSCGTLLDTVTYQAASQTDIEDDFDWRRQSGALITLGAMIEDMLSYDFIVYLPTGTDDDYLATIEQGLEEAMEIFATPSTAVTPPVLVADMPPEEVAPWVIKTMETMLEAMDEAPAAE